MISAIYQRAAAYFNPPAEVQAKVMDVKDPKVIIIGSGPAGYTAAIYAARANLYPVVFEGTVSQDSLPGGQLMTTTTVENYPGFPEGVDGAALIANMRTQALNFGARLLEEDVTVVDFSTHPYTIKGQKSTYQVPAVIVATGARANRPDIPGTRDGELWQKGVSACAVCDGALPLFRNRHLFVIGGGDTAMEEALFLSKFASRVSIVHRRDRFRASKFMQDAVFSNPKIDVVWNSVISKVEGGRKVEKVAVRDVLTGSETVHEAAGVFFATGHTPNTAFLKGQLKLDGKGYIEVKPGTTQTSVPFVFAAGDVQDPVYRQAITAAGSGCMAALDVEKVIQHQTQH